MIVMEVGIVKDGLFFFWFRLDIVMLMIMIITLKPEAVLKSLTFFVVVCKKTFPKVSPFHHS